MIALKDQFLPGMLCHALVHPLGVNRVRGVLQAVWPSLATPYAMCLVFQIKLIPALYIQPQDTATMHVETPQTNAINLPVRIQFGVERTCSSQRQP